MSEDKEMVKDVVCGMVKPKKDMPFRSEYNGKAYYFCTKMDKELFDKHPDRWVKGGSGKK